MFGIRVRDVSLNAHEASQPMFCDTPDGGIWYGRADDDR